MKKIILPLALLFSIIACNTSDKKSSGSKTDILADSLMKEIDDLHIAGMGRMAQLTKLQQQTKNLIDSINQLPDRLKKNSMAYKEKLDSLLKDLDYAEFAMDKWMPEFYANTDTLKDKVTQRLDYLGTEKIKVSKIKDAIMNGIQKADSLLKAKF